MQTQRPCLIWIIKSALTATECARTFHDDYKVALNNSAQTAETKYARGRGVKAFTKGELANEIIFPSWHTDRRAFIRLTYGDGSALITGALHVDVH